MPIDILINQILVHVSLTTDGRDAYANNGRVPNERVRGLDRRLGFRIRVDIPVANRHVLRSTQHMSRLVRIPCKAKSASPNTTRAYIPKKKATSTITTKSFKKKKKETMHHSPFPRLAHEPDVRLAQATLLGLTRVLRAVPHEHLARDSLGRDEVRVLGHVARAVDLAGVVDLLDHLDARAGRDCVAPELAALVIVGCAVELRRCGGGGGGGGARGGARGGGRSVGAWEMHCGDLEVVLGLPGGVCPEEEAVGGVGFSGRSGVVVGRCEWERG